MSDFDRERDGIWDEYDWERFLQQQDQRTEKYMELLEKYIDDPQRDEIIAREMGWTATSGAEIGAPKSTLCWTKIGDRQMTTRRPKWPMPRKHLRTIFFIGRLSR